MLLCFFIASLCEMSSECWSCTRSSRRRHTAWLCTPLASSYWWAFQTKSGSWICLSMTSAPSRSSLCEAAERWSIMSVCWFNRWYYGNSADYFFLCLHTASVLSATVATCLQLLMETSFISTPSPLLRTSSIWRATMERWVRRVHKVCNTLNPNSTNTCLSYC